jgi:hypothetical protein
MKISFTKDISWESKKDPVYTIVQRSTTTLPAMMAGLELDDGNAQVPVELLDRIVEDILLRGEENLGPSLLNHRPTVLVLSESILETNLHNIPITDMDVIYRNQITKNLSF